MNEELNSKYITKKNELYKDFHVDYVRPVRVASLVLAGSLLGTAHAFESNNFGQFVGFCSFAGMALVATEYANIRKTNREYQINRAMTSYIAEENKLIKAKKHQQNDAKHLSLKK
jgi:hypothetical protein